jgi:hypothetical protein
LGTIVDGSGPTRSRSQYYKEEVHWAKDPFLWWSDLAGGDYTEGRRDDEIDNLITDFEILSVPAAWYEEFKLVPNTNFYVNRAGWVLYGQNIPNGRRVVMDQETVQSGRITISIKTAVRRAFA